MLFKMATLCISVSMCKRFLSVLLIVLMLAPSAFALRSTEDKIDNNEGVAEALGIVTTNNVLVRAEPDAKSAVINKRKRGDKVIVLEEVDEYLKIKLPNRRVGYIAKNYINLKQAIRGEDQTATRLDKKLSIDIESLVERFNEMVGSSIYSDKHKVVPYLKILDARSVRSRVYLTLLYSSVDSEGHIVPSRQDNPLSELMKEFMEIIFIKMLLTKSRYYQVTVKMPMFSDTGNILSTYGTYAQINLDKEAVRMSEIKIDDGRIWEFVESTIPTAELFRLYPN